eukprot:2284671-Prymnesium_polylepis.1
MAVTSVTAVTHGPCVPKAETSQICRKSCKTQRHVAFSAPCHAYLCLCLCLCMPTYAAYLTGRSEHTPDCPHPLPPRGACPRHCPNRLAGLPLPHERDHSPLSDNVVAPST